MHRSWLLSQAPRYVSHLPCLRKAPARSSRPCPCLQCCSRPKEAAHCRQYNNASQDSIKASKDWFMACAAHAPGMAAQMADFAVQAPSYEQQLHVIYLANDILLKGCAANRSWG